MGGSMEIDTDNLVSTHAPSVENNSAENNSVGETSTENSQVESREASVNQPKTSMAESTDNMEISDAPLDEEIKSPVPQSNTPPPEDQLRQYQSERDRAETTLKNFAKEVSQYVQFDDYGNVIGPRVANNQNYQQQPQGDDIDPLVENFFTTGDKNTFKEIISKVEKRALEKAKYETTAFIRNNQDIERERTKLTTRFPQLFNADGSIKDRNSPLFKEANKVLMEEPDMQPYAGHPRVAKWVLEIAEGRALKANMPQIESNARNNAHQKLRSSGSSLTGISANAPSSSDSVRDYLSEDQIRAARKEGYDDAKIRRIAKLMKQAKKEGGMYLQ